MHADRLITSKDHASVQISIADVGADGRALPTSTTFAVCGQVRSQGESDDSLNRLATRAGRECTGIAVCALSLSCLQCYGTCGRTKSELACNVVARDIIRQLRWSMTLSSLDLTLSTTSVRFFQHCPSLLYSSITGI